MPTEASVKALTVIVTAMILIGVPLCIYDTCYREHPAPVKKPAVYESVELVNAHADFIRVSRAK